MVSHEVEAVADRMPDAIEKIVNDGVTVKPVVVVAGAK
jgi:hypothetical protein